MMSENFIEDESVSYQILAGAVNFEVEGVIFRLPKSILQRYESSAFSNMIGDSNNESNLPIHLTDTREAFTEFRRVVYTPLESCLSHHHRLSKDLEKVLMVQKLAHKYCLSVMENMAASAALNLAADAELLRSHTTASLTPLDILVHALDVECEELAVTARNVVKEDLWASTLCPYDVISGLNNYNEGEVQATAYYQILLKGQNNWLYEKRLDRSHHHYLYIGIANLSAEWESVFADWGSLFHVGIHMPVTNGWNIWCVYCELHSRIWRNLGAKRFQQFDVLGKLKAIKSWTTFPKYSEVVLPAVTEQINRIEGKIHSFFQDPHEIPVTESS
ncbi:uncharacterized protein EI90DRAFT_3154590 [Cantharellus anzutake]|uniref:uncharacterized protein n=1 Tax=Cantharellus anzutake TaxID=1750568 RepID=UPI001906671E|nr:uncharacterized protein EI90DRAFT_3154590 [Cantharellus anzutake]KAF8331335.1 hypothetical protein EI90DRAFT_3154590 [Cantharellus anzutake]